MSFYRHFLVGAPEYLARYYWWAYLWRAGIWFFDHQPIINAILFGQYNRLMQATLNLVPEQFTGRTLQLTCVYGKLTPALLQRCPQGLHIMDVATAQLRLVRSKCEGSGALYPARMNAECLGYRRDVFDTVVLFFLLHEMPATARRHTLAEMMRVVRPGGRVLVVEYGPKPVHHLLYRLWPLRWLLGRLEPFLPGFWQENLDEQMQVAARACHKSCEQESKLCSVFSGFYRVVEYRVLSDEHDTQSSEGG